MVPDSSISSGSASIQLIQDANGNGIVDGGDVLVGTGATGGSTSLHQRLPAGTYFTAVNRNMDNFSDPYLASTAYVGAVDFRHRFYKNTFEVSGSLDASRVQGSRENILATQTNSGLSSSNGLRSNQP